MFLRGDEGESMMNRITVDMDHGLYTAHMRKYTADVVLLCCNDAREDALLFPSLLSLQQTHGRSGL